MISIRHFQLTLAVGAATLAFTTLPIGFDASTLTFHMTRAIADSANGHGQGGGHANGKANGHANGNASGKANGQSQGATASGLGSLNAAHASATALNNANTGSQVGKIAAYKEAELAAQKAVADDQAVTDAQSTLDAALAANADGDPLNDVDQATIDGLTQDLADAQAAAAETDAVEAQAAADAALIDASNKEITDDGGNVLSDIRDAVNDLLGIN